MTSISLGIQGRIGTKESVVAGKDYVRNPRFSGNYNGWSGTATKSVVDGGVYLSSTGTFYQQLSNYDILGSHYYMARCYVTSISGTVTMDVGTTAGGSDLGTIELQTGWNGIKFNGTTTVYLSFNDVSNATITIKEVHVNEQIDLYVTGNFINV